MEFQELSNALQAFGLSGVVAALVILTGVYAAKKGGIVATGDHARIANLVIGAIVTGLGTDPTAEKALTSVIASLLAALLYQGIEYFTKRA